MTPGSLFSTARRARAVAIGASAFGLLGAVATARGQAPTQQFSVTTRAGSVTFDRAASLNPSPFVGLDAEYGLNRFFSLGTALTVMRPATHKQDFVTTLTFGTALAGDTTFYYETGQSINIVDGEFIGVARYPAGRLTPFLLGGGGVYGMFFDPQENRGQRRASGAAFTVGGGVAVRLSERAGLQFDVRSLNYSNYKRSLLQQSGGRFPNVTFVEDFPTRPAAKSTISNFSFSIGFRYVPDFHGGGISDTPVEQP
jgi:hypothetical protein